MSKSWFQDDFEKTGRGERIEDTDKEHLDGLPLVAIEGFCYEGAATLIDLCPSVP